MKVQTKIILLLVGVTAIFAAGVWFLRLAERQNVRRIAEERFTERHRSFEDFLEHHGEPLKTMVLDYTAWDQMVDATVKGDDAWFEENVDDAALDSFHSNAVWIYGKDGNRVHRTNNLGSEGLDDVPLPRESMAQIFAQAPLAHFFAETPLGLMEICGGTIHPSKDFERTTPPEGFFFAARLWSQPMLDEMSMFTGNKVSLAPPTRTGENLNDEKDGVIAFSRPLHSWDGRPLADLVVRNESPVVRELNRASERLIFSLVLFSLALLFILAFALVRWVSRPLRQAMESLKRNDPKPILGLCHDNSEFGELARTIRMFFEQRDNLLREMEERRAAEEALRKSEEELRHSQKMEAIGRLAGGVAHDFNNLLTAIIGYADLVNARAANDPVVRQHADLIVKAGEQAAALTRQLLAFSRKQILQPRVIDLNQLVVDMEKLLRRVIGERYHLETRPEAENGRVKADPTQIEQVILNLSVNARDAMPSGGKLLIRTANVQLDAISARKIATSLEAGDYVELSVRDNGTGMDEQTMTHMFEPFFTTKGPGKGTGLGLATVYGIVRQSGGGISAESAPGKGTIFRVYLPMERRPVEPRHTSAPTLERSRNFETVLVVEDEEIVRQLVCDVLEEQGYNVLCAADGVEALRLASEFDGHIHLLVSDVIMPHMNGPELAEQLSAARPGLKILFVSGYSTNDISDHGVLEPGVELLQKPFTPQVFARRVRDVIEERSQAEVAPAR